MSRATFAAPTATAPATLDACIAQLSHPTKPYDLDKRALLELIKLGPAAATAVPAALEQRKNNFLLPYIVGLLYSTGQPGDLALQQAVTDGKVTAAEANTLRSLPSTGVEYEQSLRADPRQHSTRDDPSLFVAPLLFEDLHGNDPNLIRHAIIRLQDSDLPADEYRVVWSHARDEDADLVMHVFTCASHQTDVDLLAETDDIAMDLARNSPDEAIAVAALGYFRSRARQDRRYVDFVTDVALHGNNKNVVRAAVLALGAVTAQPERVMRCLGDVEKGDSDFGTACDKAFVQFAWAIGQPGPGETREQAGDRQAVVLNQLERNDAYPSNFQSRGLELICANAPYTAKSFGWVLRSGTNGEYRQNWHPIDWFLQSARPELSEAAADLANDSKDFWRVRVIKLMQDRPWSRPVLLPEMLRRGGNARAMAFDELGKDPSAIDAMAPALISVFDDPDRRAQPLALHAAISLPGNPGSITVICKAIESGRKDLQLTAMSSTKNFATQDALYPPLWQMLRSTDSELLQGSLRALSELADLGHADRIFRAMPNLRGQLQLLAYDHPIAVQSVAVRLAGQLHLLPLRVPDWEWHVATEMALVLLAITSTFFAVARCHVRHPPEDRLLATQRLVFERTQAAARSAGKHIIILAIAIRLSTIGVLASAGHASDVTDLLPWLECVAGIMTGASIYVWGNAVVLNGGQSLDLFILLISTSLLAAAYVLLFGHALFVAFTAIGTFAGNADLLNRLLMVAFEGAMAWYLLKAIFAASTDTKRRSHLLLAMAAG